MMWPCCSDVAIRSCCVKPNYIERLRIFCRLIIKMTYKHWFGPSESAAREGEERSMVVEDDR
jgi:hypothetical protein